MQSLTDLNSYSSTGIEVADPRPARAVFNYMYPEYFELDVVKTIESTSVSVDPKIEIVEVINYQTANVRYRVEIKNISGSSITFPTLPSGVTLSTVGNVYTLSGINSESVWDSIKSFTWTLPVNYASSKPWYLSVSIIYFDQINFTEESITWNVYDHRYYYDAELKSISTILINPGAIRVADSIEMHSEFVMREYFINLEATFHLTAIATDFISLKSQATLNANADVLPALQNMGYSRPYYIEQSNAVFESNTPYITLPATVSDSFELKIYCANSYFGFTSAQSLQHTFSLTGTKDEINTALPQLRYYPYSGSDRDTYFDVELYKNGSKVFSKRVAVTYLGVGSIPTNIYQFTSSGTYSFTAEEWMWGFADVLIIGGGGGGGSAATTGAAGGGGGGELTYLVNSFLGYDVEHSGFFNNFTVTIGTGGTVGNNGTASSVVGLHIVDNTSVGGYKGNTAAALGYSSGGSSTAYSGGSGSGGSWYGDVWRCGGGGGGSAGSGGSGSIINPNTRKGGDGGIGTLINITGTSQYYACGGGGGAYTSNSDTTLPGNTYTTPGSGGRGAGEGSAATAGQDGIVIIKVHA